MEWTQLTPYLGLLLGVMGRILLPWLMTQLEGDAPWDWRKAAGQVVAGLSALLVLVALNPDLPTLTLQQALAVGLLSSLGGWGVADIGRTAQKAKRFVS